MLEQKHGGGEAWWSDGWDGYPAGRQRIVSQIAQQKIENGVVIGGDIRSFWVADLKPKFGDPNAPTVATEFVGTSVTSEGVPYEVFNGFLPENPHIKFLESHERGYVHAPIRGCTARWLSTLATPGTRSAARRSAFPSSRVATMPQRCTAPSRITMLT
jgi:phosphodiesterase/alkaline phosphatase D-like protein